MGSYWLSFRLALAEQNKFDGANSVIQKAHAFSSKATIKPGSHAAILFDKIFYIKWPIIIKATKGEFQRVCSSLLYPVLYSTSPWPRFGSSPTGTRGGNNIDRFLNPTKQHWLPPFLGTKCEIGSGSSPNAKAALVSDSWLRVRAQTMVDSEN